jgi:hypothetical protein
MNNITKKEILKNPEMYLKIINFQRKVIEEMYYYIKKLEGFISGVYS